MYPLGFDPDGHQDHEGNLLAWAGLGIGSTFEHQPVNWGEYQRGQNAKGILITHQWIRWEPGSQENQDHPNSKDKAAKIKVRMDKRFIGRMRR
jgi:hypothetical protein